MIDITFVKGAHLDARKGELWLLQLDGAGEVRSAACSEGMHTRPLGQLIFEGEGIHTLIDDHHIVAGHRLWPTPSSADVSPETES